MAEDTAAITIDGIAYTIATADTWSLDEGAILYDYSGLTLDQFEENPLNPKALKALLHISVARKQVTLDFTTISDMVGTVTYSEIVAALAETEDDAGPPSPTASGSEPSGLETSSGENGTNGSAPDPEASPLDSTGGLLSDSSRSA